MLSIIKKIKVKTPGSHINDALSGTISSRNISFLIATTKQLLEMGAKSHKLKSLSGIKDLPGLPTYMEGLGDSKPKTHVEE